MSMYLCCTRWMWLFREYRRYLCLFVMSALGWSQFYSRIVWWVWQDFLSLFLSLFLSVSVSNSQNVLGCSVAVLVSHAFAICALCLAAVWLVVWLAGCWLAGWIGCSGTPAPLPFVGLWVAPLPSSHRGLHNAQPACLPVESRINTEQASVTRSIYTHISAALLPASRRCRFLESRCLLSFSVLIHFTIYVKLIGWCFIGQNTTTIFTGLC